MGSEDDEGLDRLVTRAAGGDEAGWQQLWAVLEPFLEHVVRQPRFLGPLGQHEDERRNIIVEVMARLRADRFERLGRYVAAANENPALRFHSWLRVVAKRVGIDYLRRHPDYIDRRHEVDAGTTGTWVPLESLGSHHRIPATSRSMTDRHAARELLAFANPGQRRILELWAQGAAFEEIATAVGLSSPAEAERAVRAAIERLRRRFRTAA